MVRKLAFLLPFIALLAACGPTAAPVPTVQPTAVVEQPTSAPPTTAPPTAVPTSAPVSTPAVAPSAVSEPVGEPVPAGVLPAPLYVLQNGQIYRLEVDGLTQTPITDEEPMADDMIAIVEFAVSPADGSLAYVVQGVDGHTLVLSDAQGQNRRVLIEKAPLTAPRWSPDGSALAVQMMAYTGVETPWQSGVYAVSAISGEARLLIANDPVPPHGVGDAWGYAPEAWSPDGSKLLVGRFSLVAEMCESAVVAVDSGALTLFKTPEDETPPWRAQCRGGTWAADSSAIYTVVRGPGMSPPIPGLYRADATSGVMTFAIPENDAQSRFNIVQAQSVGADGVLRVLLAVTDKIPDITLDPNMPPTRVKPYRMEADGTLTAVREEDFILFGFSEWAPDDSGVLIPAQTDGGNLAYYFVPNEGEIVALPIEQAISVMWAR
jgi:hypothetical protein